MKAIESEGFSSPVELANIPEGTGVCIISDEAGRVLQIVESSNIRRRIGAFFDCEGTICVHGPKIFDYQQEGHKVFVQWKLTSDHKAEKKGLVRKLELLWAPGDSER
jgi:hypothetical protein